MDPGLIKNIYCISVLLFEWQNFIIKNNADSRKFGSFFLLLWKRERCKKVKKCITYTWFSPTFYSDQHLHLDYNTRKAWTIESSDLLKVLSPYFSKSLGILYHNPSLLYYSSLYRESKSFTVPDDVDVQY